MTVIVDNNNEFNSIRVMNDVNIKKLLAQQNVLKALITYFSF